MIYQSMGHRRGYFLKKDDGTMEQVIKAQGYKQLGLAFGTLYRGPVYRDGEAGRPDFYAAIRSHYKKASIRLISRKDSPWTIDIDYPEDLDVAERYLSTTPMLGRSCSADKRGGSLPA
jgi:hypothetical protein